ncbi:MAG: hypothetical protein Q4F41_09420 [Eubacteriales bacterium]|nr:hypothetical protein [Eubacteriales bacterium]
MNQEKNEHFKLDGYVHTLSVTSEGIIETIPDELALQVETRSHTSGDTVRTSTKINPNKRSTGNVLCYSELLTEVEHIMQTCGVHAYQYNRCDFSLNSYDPEHYERYLKLYRLLISMVSCAYGIENTYITHDLWEVDRVRSIAIKNRSIETESYDKALESHGSSDVYSRLEIRSKRIEDKEPDREFCETWKKRFEKAMKAFQETQDGYNAQLFRIYQKYKDARPVRFRCLTDFILQYQDVIFTRRQLIGLLSMFPEEVPDPVKRAKSIKRHYGIEFFSKKDLENAIGEIMAGVEAYFSC